MENELDIDSLSATEILVVIEKKYDIEINPAKALDISTVKDLVELVRNCL